MTESYYKKNPYELKKNLFLGKSGKKVYTLDDLKEIYVDEDRIIKSKMTPYTEKVLIGLRNYFGTEDPIPFSKYSLVDENIGENLSSEVLTIDDWGRVFLNRKTPLMIQWMNALWKRKKVRKFFRGHWGKKRIGGRLWGVHYLLSYNTDDDRWPINKA